MYDGPSSRVIDLRMCSTNTRPKDTSPNDIAKGDLARDYAQQLNDSLESRSFGLKAQL